MMPTKDELIEKMAEAMQSMFPVVNQGTDENGNWCIKPLEIELFRRCSEVALDAFISNLPKSCVRGGHDARLYVSGDWYTQLLGMKK